LDIGPQEWFFMVAHLQSRVAIVIGSTSGIGEAIVAIR
jgi:hypothetical protein